MGRGLLRRTLCYGDPTLRDGCQECDWPGQPTCQSRNTIGRPGQGVHRLSRMAISLPRSWSLIFAHGISGTCADRDRGRCYAVDADGSHRTLLISGARGSGPNLPARSPDGRTLVYFSTPGTRAHFVAEVWTINSDGSGKRRLYRSACCVGLWAAPIWSPDGRQIAFSADSAGGTFVMNADGSRLHRVSKAWASQVAWRR